MPKVEAGPKTIEEAHRILEEAGFCVVCQGPHDRTRHLPREQRETSPEDFDVTDAPNQDDITTPRETPRTKREG